MDYEKLHKKIWDLMQSMHSTADQIDGLGEEFPDMAKEIDEQPITIKNCVNEYIDRANKDINLLNFPWKVNDISSVVLIGCGTAYHSCLMGKFWFEQSRSQNTANK